VRDLHRADPLGALEMAEPAFDLAADDSTARRKTNRHARARRPQESSLLASGVEPERIRL
jgi:hypothetical protein